MKKGKRESEDESVMDRWNGLNRRRITPAIDLACLPLLIAWIFRILESDANDEESQEQRVSELGVFSLALLFELKRYEYQV